MAANAPVEVALLGAGPRGEFNIGSVFRLYPKHLNYVAVAEPNPERREFFIKTFKIDLITLAAEKARLSNQVVEMDAFRKEAEANPLPV